MGIEAGFALPLLAAAGLVAGFVNTVAGAGSLITLPALLLLGLPADVANGTNRVAVLAQSLVGGLAFDRSGRLDRGAVLAIVAPTLAGSFAGAWLASRLSPEILEPVLIAALLFIAVTLVWRPRILSPREGSAPVQPGARPAALAGLFAIGVYGGFVQAGVGLFLLALLGGVLRYDLVRANALKVVAVGAFTAVALAVFVAAGQVMWLPGLVLSLGTVAGARLAVRFAVVRGAEAVRWVVFAVAVVSCAAALLR